MDGRSTHIEHISQHLKQSNEKLITTLNQLDAGCKEIEKFYAEYDFDDKSKHNGLRSHVAMVDRMIANIAKLVPAASREERNKLADYTIVSVAFLKVQAMMQRVREKGVTFDASNVTDLDIEVLADSFAFDEAEVVPIFGRLGPFWLDDYAREEEQKHDTAGCWATANLVDKVRMLMSSSFAAKLQANKALCMSLETVKKLKSLKFKANVDNVTLHNVWIERSSDWVIRVVDCVTPAVIEKASDKRTGSVRSLVITPNEPNAVPEQTSSNNEALIFHIHGGACLLGDPEYAASALAKDAIALNVPVISINYGLAPEHKYPAGVQDLLDVYLFLTSGTDRVKKLIGFHPKSIILTGESCVGLLAIALTTSLRMIQQTGAEVLMPKGLSLQVPCTTPGPMAFPSNVTFDGVLIGGLCALVFAEYAHIDPPAVQNWHRLEGKKDVLKRLTERMKDPLYNAFAGNYLADNKDIKLSLLLSEFDPVLDQGIALAKKWPGERRLLVTRGVSHGMAFQRHEKMAMEWDWVYDGMADQLGIERKK